MTGFRPKTMRLRAIIRECHALEVSQKRIGEMTRTVGPTISIHASSMGLRFSKSWGGRNGQHASAKTRAEVMATLYRDGYTLAAIGAQFAVTRERVRQILAKHKRMTGADGGQAVRARRLKQRREAATEAVCQRKWGCTVAQRSDLLAIGRRMVRDGSRWGTTPTGAFTLQKRNAASRGIGWELNLWQWWTLWQQSGHWAERGRGQGYVMCRVGDDGPYSLGNVFIATAASNTRDGMVNNHRIKDPSLPIGVRRTKSGKYCASRHINGICLRLGTHPTPELAHAAYLQASA